jgi:EAL domain-containing protein (putative c-di-GMP-specific phosphodiesterase class I)
VVRAMLAATAAGEGTVEQLLELARRHLEMDVAFVSQFTDGRQVYRAVDGDGGSFGIRPGDGPVLVGTLCRRMIDGDVPQVIPDAAADVRVGTLRTTREMGIRAYIGVPLVLPDGRLYGTLCCLARRASTMLGRRDVRFLELLADLLVGQLAAEVHEQEAHDRIARVIESRDLTMAAQPIVSLRDGRCLGMEALARFPAAMGAPDVVFVAAHRAGLGPALERLAGREAFGLMPLLAPEQYLGINMSPEAALVLAPVLDPDLAPPLHRLVLEITEHAEVDSYATLGEALRPLRDGGLRLAIDDAGAGYASLRHVIELQPDVIKIDRSLVHGLAEDRARRRIVSNFVLLARDLQATVIAEGVEVSADLAAIRDLGVDAAQGNLVARPTTDHDELRRWTSPLTTPRLR